MTLIPTTLIQKALTDETASFNQSQSDYTAWRTGPREDNQRIATIAIAIGAQPYITNVVGAVATETAKQGLVSKPGFFATTLVQTRLEETVSDGSWDFVTYTRADRTALLENAVEVSGSTSSSRPLLSWTGVVGVASTSASGSGILAPGATTTSTGTDHGSSSSMIDLSESTTASSTFSVFDDRTSPSSASQASAAIEPASTQQPEPASSGGQFDHLALAIILGILLPLLAITTICGFLLYHYQRKTKPNPNAQPLSAVGVEKSKTQTSSNVKPKERSHAETVDEATMQAELGGIPIHRPTKLAGGSSTPSLPRFVTRDSLHAGSFRLAREDSEAVER